MSVRIKPGDEPAWQWQADDDNVADPADIHGVFDPEPEPTGWLARPQRGGITRPSWTRGTAGVLIGTMSVLVVGGLMYRLSLPAPTAAPAPVAPTVSAAPPTPSPSPSAPPSAAPAGTMAMPWQGAALPVSDTAGPEQFTDTRSTGFSHDPQGAAFAAVHISTHIDPLTGPDVFTPTIEEQVVGAPDLMTTTEQAYRKAARDMGLSPEAIADGTAVLAPTGDISQWRIGTYRPTAVTTVELLVTAPQGQQLIYEVPVIWRDGDWRLTFEGAVGSDAAVLRATPADTHDLSDFTPFITRGNQK